MRLLSLCATQRSVSAVGFRDLRRMVNASCNIDEYRAIQVVVAFSPSSISCTISCHVQETPRRSLFWCAGSLPQFQYVARCCAPLLGARSFSTAFSRFRRRSRRPLFNGSSPVVRVPLAHGSRRTARRARACVCAH